MKTLSLKFQFAIVMTVGVLALAAGISALGLHYAQKDVLARLSNQQLGIVSSTADELDAKLKHALDAVTASALAMPLDAVTDGERFRAFCAERPALLEFFDDLLIIDTKGIVTANHPAREGLIGVDLSERNYFRRVMATGKPSISEPVRGKLSGLPIVNFVTPIVDAKGNVMALMLGALNLYKPNFVGALSSARMGKLGYFTAIAGSPDPVYLVHPDPARILQRVPSERNSAMALVLNATAAGVDVSTLEDGSEVLISYRPLAMSKWVLAAIIPIKEALAVIDRARDRTIEASVLLALFVLPLVWLFAWLLLQPLTRLRREVDALAEGRESNALVFEGRHDEVGEVARAFNAMLKRQRASEALRIASEEGRRQLVAILESSTDFVAMTNAQGFLTYINASGRLIRGIGLNDDISQTTIRDYFPQWAVEKIRNEAVPAALTRGIWFGETAVYTRNGPELPIDHMLIAHRNADGKLEFFSSLMRDISQAKAAAAAIRSSEARMLAITDALPEMVAFVDCDYRLRFVNSRYEDFFRIDRAEILGKTFAQVVGEESFKAQLPYFERAKLGETMVFERQRMEHGRNTHFKVQIIPQYDDDRQLTGFHVIHQDVTDYKVEHRRLSKLASTDALTGLLNRAGFEAAIIEAMSRSERNRSTMALFYIDIDHFKSINDTHGHITGDTLLREFAARLNRAVRSADVVARLGGDEFVVIAESLRSDDDVRAIGEKMLRSVRSPLEGNGTVLRMTASIGIAIFSGESIESDELIERADAALYRAKIAGRDRYALGNPTLLLEGPASRIAQAPDRLIA